MPFFVCDTFLALVASVMALMIDLASRLDSFMIASTVDFNCFFNTLLLNPYCIFDISIIFVWCMGLIPRLSSLNFLSCYLNVTILYI